MKLVEEYKGVKIFITNNNEFYCDAIENSDIYRNKTFKSYKLESIEKEIDLFKEDVVDGNEYYEINIHNTSLKLLKVTNKVDRRLFFDDGTDTNSYTRTSLYPKKIEKTKAFKQLKVAFKTIVDTRKQIGDLHKKQGELISEAKSKLSLLCQVIVA